VQRVVPTAPLRARGHVVCFGMFSSKVKHFVHGSSQFGNNGRKRCLVFVPTVRVGALDVRCCIPVLNPMLHTVTTRVAVKHGIDLGQELLQNGRIGVLHKVVGIGTYTKICEGVSLRRFAVHGIEVQGIRAGTFVVESGPARRGTSFYVRFNLDSACCRRSSAARRPDKAAP
jgi:hypothetical protein